MSHDPVLQLIGRVLRETGGYLTVPDGAEGELVISRREDFVELQQGAHEVQLSLLTQRPRTGDTAETTADEVLERINKEIALYYVQEAEVAALAESETGAATTGEEEHEVTTGSFKAPVRPPGVGNNQAKRVRFEPLRGDLSPDLQE